MKRIFSIALALALVLSLGGAALAADDFLDLADGAVYVVAEPVHLHRLTIDETSALTAVPGYTPAVTVDGYLKTIEPGTAYEFYGDVDLFPVEDAIVGTPIRGASAAYIENAASVAFADQTFLSQERRRIVAVQDVRRRQRKYGLAVQEVIHDGLIVNACGIDGEIGRQLLVDHQTL